MVQKGRDDPKAAQLPPVLMANPVVGIVRPLADIEKGAFRNPGRKLISAAMAIGGAAVCSLSFMGPLFAAGILMIVIGASTALFTPVVWVVLQEMTPGHMLARVMTTFSTGGMFAAMLGMTVFGWAADALGATVSLIGIGMVLLVTAGLAARFSRRCEMVQEAAMDPLPAA